MQKKISLLVIALLVSACGSSPKKDSSTYSAIEANDMTLIMSGCGEKPYRGMLLCRVPEGGASDARISIHVPAITAEFVVVRKDGSIHPIGTADPAGNLSLTLGELTGLDGPVVPWFGGPYRVLGELHYELEGQPAKEIVSGLVYVLVIKKGYVSLGCESPDAVWNREIPGGCRAEYTTAMRSAICGESCGTGR